jgi:hypothetical protein
MESSTHKSLKEELVNGGQHKSFARKPSLLCGCLALGSFALVGVLALQKQNIAKFTRVPPVQLAASPCTAILKEGLYDKFETTDEYAMDQALKSFDESYTYSDYSKDWSTANAASESSSSLKTVTHSLSAGREYLLVNRSQANSIASLLK